MVLDHHHRLGAQRSLIEDDHGLAQSRRILVWRVEHDQVESGEVGLMRPQPVGGLGARDVAVLGEARKAKFSATMLAQVRSISTNVAQAAPRESASSPSVPAPANRSSTRTPRMLSPMMLKRASRTIEVVGRVVFPGGVFSARPRWIPAVIRVAAPGTR